MILVSTLRELLVMPYKIVRPPSSNAAYPAILVPEAISPGRVNSYTRQNCAYPAIQVPEAINPERAISYARLIPLPGLIPVSPGTQGNC